MNYAIGVDIGGTNTRVALLNDKYEVIERISFSTDAKNPLMTVEKISEVVKSFDGDIVGIGVSCPGPLDLFEGKVLTPPNLQGWHGFEIEKEIKRLTGITTYLENDANLAGLAEAHIGAGKGLPFVQYMTISTGIGGGYVANREIYLGARGFAQEIANVILVPNGPVLNKLMPGALEAICSGTAITHRANILGLKVDHAGDVNELALDGNAEAIQIMDDAKEYLANAIATIYGFLDPNIVVLGGGVALKIDGFVKDVESRVKNKVYDIQKENIKVVKATLGDDNGLIGGGILAFTKFGKSSV